MANDPETQALLDLIPLHRKVDEYYRLTRSAAKATSEILVKIMKVALDAKAGDEAAMQTLKKDESGKSSPEGFAAAVRDEQLEPLADLKRAEKNALRILEELNQEATRMYASGTPEMKKLLDDEKEFGVITTTPQELKSIREETKKIFNAAIQNVGIHGKSESAKR